ncbi:MAG TPA: hypothetical protein VK843_04345 [Planctomycetota bacterium]|nr:hypothetical protein [Planctomycetota bacterium]
MGLTRYLFNDWFTAIELDQVEQRLDIQRQHRLLTERDVSAQAARIDELERNLGRVAVLSRALAEACLQAGVLELEALKAKILEADLADGVEDGKLDPRVVMPGEQRLASLDSIREQGTSGEFQA